MNVKAIVWCAVAALALLPVSEAALAAPDFTHLRIRSVGSTMDGASQWVTFDVVRVGETPLILAGRTVTVRDMHGRARSTVLDGDSDRTTSQTVTAYSSVWYPEDEDDNSGWGMPPANLWLPPRFLPVGGGTLVVDGMDEWSFGPLPLDGSELGRDGTHVPEVSRRSVLLQVREYYHAGMDHYLLTANAAEFDALDYGDVPGWRPTGIAYLARTLRPSPQYVPVCRLLFLYASGYSHFMSNFVDECTAWANSGMAILETAEAFYMAASDGASCPDETISYTYPDGRSALVQSTGSPIYRLWNGKPEANHRYIIDKATRDSMVTHGWVSEGAGPDGVAMCGYAGPDPFLGFPLRTGPID